MSAFRPTPPLTLTARQKQRLSEAFAQKSTLEPHSIRSVSGLSHAEAVILMFQLRDAGLAELWLRVFEVSTGLPIADIPFAQGFIPLPVVVPDRDEPISSPDDLRYGLVVEPTSRIDVQ